MPGMLQPQRELTFHPDGTATVTVWSLFGSSSATMRLPLSQLEYAAWQAGDYIQHAMPHLSPGQREFILTGLTPDAWDAMFKEEEE